MSEFLSFEVSSYRQSAADTEMLKLSVKPYIGILTNSSAFSITMSDRPGFSEPKNKANLPLVMSKSFIKTSFVCGEVATIL